MLLQRLSTALLPYPLSATADATPLVFSASHAHSLAILSSFNTRTKTRLLFRSAYFCSGKRHATTQHSFWRTYYTTRTIATRRVRREEAPHPYPTTTGSSARCHIPLPPTFLAVVYPRLFVAANLTLHYPSLHPSIRAKAHSPRRCSQTAKVWLQ